MAPEGTVVTSAVGFQLLTVAPTPPKVAVLEPCEEPKFDPEMVTEVPTGPEAVLRAVMTGAELVTANVAPGDVPAESVTVTVAVPVAAIRLAGTAAISSVELASVVIRAVLPHITVAPEAKSVPYTVRANPAPPATADVGDVPPIVGVPTENVESVGVVPEEEPSEFVTDMITDSELATRFAGTAACSSVELTKVVVNEVLAEPAPPLFHSTVAPGVKFVP
jgi:hypothetical protein